jgi:protein ImuB
VLRDACRARLASLPPSLLRAAGPHLALLDGLGLRTVGALDALPRDGAAQRFGPALLDELDRAFGGGRSPRAWFVAPAVFAARLECRRRSRRPRRCCSPRGA